MNDELRVCLSDSRETNDTKIEVKMLHSFKQKNDKNGKTNANAFSC